MKKDEIRVQNGHLLDAKAPQFKYPGLVNGNGHPAHAQSHPGQNGSNGKHAASHSVASPTTPLLTELSAEEKMARVQKNFAEILESLGLDLTDDSLSGTPRRVAKMFVQEIFKGLHPDNAPEITLFENTYGYAEMLVERDIDVQSTCEHHFLPIIGVAHVAYIPRDKVVGLSKLNRVVDYFSRRPQVQERLTLQIAEFLKEKLQTPDVAVLIDAKHFCVSTRGVEDPCSSTVTASYSGAFQDRAVREEFLKYVGK